MAPIPEAWGGRIAGAPPCVGEEQEADPERSMEMDVLIKQVQTRVYQRRIRSRDAFRDYDRFRCGRCTRQQFARAVSSLCPILRPEELANLADRFTDDGPKARWPQNVDWLRFCQVVDEVFGVPCLEGRPEVKVPKPGAALPCTAGFRPAPSANEARAREVLRRLALLLRTRGVDLSDCYLYCQRTDAACQVGARGSGKLSRTMFLQRFPFLPDFAERDLDLLCQRFAAANGTVDVHALLRAVDAQPEPGSQAEAPAPECEAAPEEEAEAEEEPEAEAEEEPAAKGPAQAARQDDGAATRAAPPPPMPRRPSSAESLRRAVSASRLTKDALASEAPRQKAGPSRPSSACGLRSSASFRSVASQGEKERTLPPRPHSSATSTRSTGSGLRRDAAEVSTPSLDSTLRPGALEEAQAAEADDAPEVEPMEVARPQPQQLQRRASSVTPAAASRPSSGHSRSSSARPASSWPAHTVPAGMPSGMSAAAGAQRPTSATQGPREPWAKRRDTPPAPTAADVLAKLRALVAERRLRVSDCFQDADRLRKGTCSFTQLRTALTLVGLELEPQEYELLFEGFRTGDAFRYRDFCAEVTGEAVDVCVHGCVKGLTSSRSKAELDQKARSALEDLEGQLRRRAQVRRVELRSTFENFSRARPGHVTRAQFARIMAMHGFRLTEEQISVICRAYCDTQDQQGLNYLLFCASMEQPRSRPDAGGGAALTPAPPAGAPPGGGSAGPRSRPARYLGGAGHQEPGARKHPAGMRR